jgi:hypothetical protein
MPRNPDPNQPDDDDLEIGQEPDDEEDDDSGDEPEDREQSVSRQPNPAPIREQEEEELAEADLLDQADVDDLKNGEGPDA